MKLKNILVLVSLFGLTSSAALAENFLRPTNVQNAYIDTENKNELRIGFDWLHEHDDGVSLDKFNLPRVNYRRSFDTKLPTRFSLGTGLVLNTFDIDEYEDSSFATSPIDLGLELGLINKPQTSINIYFDQSFPLGSARSDASLFSIPAFNIINLNIYSYSFQTGTRYQFNFLKNLYLFGDLGYRKVMGLNDSSSASSDIVTHSNEILWDTHTWLNPSIAFLGQNYLFDGIDSMQQYYLIPSIIMPLGKERNQQLRIGVPTSFGDSFLTYDIGIQVSYFASF